MRHYTIVLLLIFAIAIYGYSASSIDSGYQITVTISDYDNDTLLLGQHYGNQQFLKDTAFRNDSDQFVFEDDKDLEGGVYLIVLKPNNDFFQLLINPGERQIDITAKNGKVPEIETIKGSDDNLLFKDYVGFIQEKSPIAAELRKQIEEKKVEGNDIGALETELKAINEAVQKRQEELFENHPNSMTTLLIKGAMNPVIPEFEGTKEEVDMKRFKYYRKHYFDNIDMKDPRILRTPFLFSRIDSYLEKLTPKVPDSINQALDLIFSKLEGNEETYKYYLIHYLNHFANSKFVGMDAIYVYLVENYYAQGEAPWIEEKQLNKMIDNARRLKPILIGQKAPDLKMRLQDESFVSIYETDCEYMVLFFWDPDCPHCKKQIPDMAKFYEQYKDQDIKVFGICTKLNSAKEPEAGKVCWKYIEEKPEMQDWINVADPMHLTRYKIIYDLKTTPQIFVLDKNKIIRSKRIGADQLPDVMEHLYLQDGKTVKGNKDSEKSEK